MPALGMAGNMKFFDEMRGDGEDIRAPYQEYNKLLSTIDPEKLKQKSAEAEAFFRRTGITFNVYGETEADERLIPFDMLSVVI